MRLSAKRNAEPYGNGSDWGNNARTHTQREGQTDYQEPTEAETRAKAPEAKVVMPVRVVKKPVKGPKDFAIVEKSTGKVKGRSTSRAKAKASARIRNEATQGK